MPHLFAYGSLQLPSVFAAVTGQQKIGQPAKIEGYARYRLRDLSYPGLVAESGAITEGLLYLDLDAGAWARLDRFEDVFYRRETLTVTALGVGEVFAEAYVMPTGDWRLIDRQAWSLEVFREQHLSDFMRRCLG
jgi:gamma-glutamylcyclotransferase (GGCT)/AIG2-like uncharacterized protein YtfP